MNLLEFMRIRLKIREILQKLSRLFWRFIFKSIQKLSGRRPNVLYLIGSQVSPEDLADLKLRADFYLSASRPFQWVERERLPLTVLLSRAPVLVFGPRSPFLDWLIVRRPGLFDVDFRQNPLDGWAWTGLADYLKPQETNFKSAYDRLTKRFLLLKEDGRSKCYIFGTGPSLANAMNQDWSDGYRIVCNTIVRDPQLWEHLQPDFIVAGDAIYHFGHTRFARAFRHDLGCRLAETDTMFIYPAQFHTIVLREFQEFQDRLIPIPSGWRRIVHSDLTKTFRLPNLGNVLGLLLLPLGCTLSNRIYLMGFDGRAPGDELFWKNSSKHTYPEYMQDLRNAHPRFFDHYVPSSDPNKYVREYQGDVLETVLQSAEKKGWTFEMLHSSWTPALQKRYHGGK